MSSSDEYLHRSINVQNVPLPVCFSNNPFKFRIQNKKITNKSNLCENLLQKSKFKSWKRDTIVVRGKKQFYDTKRKR